MTLVDIRTEGRVIAAMLIEPAVLRASCDVELNDLTDPRLRAVFAAIRHLQSRSMLVNIFDVHAQLVRTDEEHETHVAQWAGLVFMAGLLCVTPHYAHPVLWEHDLAWLRELANRRRAATAAAEPAPGEVAA